MDSDLKLQNTCVGIMKESYKIIDRRISSYNGAVPVCARAWNETRADPDTMSRSFEPLPAYLQEPVAGLADEGEAHGSFRHGELAVFIPRGRPSELPQLLGDGKEQGHGHQAGGQSGQSRDQVESVEQHGDGEPGGLSGALGDVQKDVESWA